MICQGKPALEINIGHLTQILPNRYRPLAQPDPNRVNVWKRETIAAKIRCAILPMLVAKEYRMIDWDQLAALAGVTRHKGQVYVGLMVRSKELLRQTIPGQRSAAYSIGERHL